MKPFFKNFRPLLISLVVLMLTAGIVIAGKPDVVGAGRIASEAAGKALHVVTEPAETTETETDTDTDTDTETDTEVPSHSAGHCLVDPTTATPKALAALTHGAIVCWAAHQDTPDGYANHGAFVSEWARKNHGSDASAKGAAKAAANAVNGAGHGGTRSPHQP